MVSRVGPTVEIDCDYCQGSGAMRDLSLDHEPLMECPYCHGTGKGTRTVHPFGTLERAMEHVQAVRTCMRLRRTENFKPKRGTPAYHVDAAEDAIRSLFQELVVLLPEEYERTEGS